ncbi:MAG: hypothetical protein HC770_01465 [Pseudanabaena sp. CRU_2_10]|nr:hypothetical protein [Pseudanabaena sp. CRU_2_10]
MLLVARSQASKQAGSAFSKPRRSRRSSNLANDTSPPKQLPPFDDGSRSDRQNQPE